MKTLSAAACVMLLMSCVSAYGWKAYNDLSWTNGQLDVNITTYTTTNGNTVATTNGALVEFTTGTNLAAQIAVSGGGWNAGSHALLQGADGATGTDAYNVFTGAVHCTGVISYGAGEAIEIRVSGLDSDVTYNLVLFSNRANDYSPERISQITLSDADDFKNYSSTGSEYSGTNDASTEISCTNTVNGYIVRFAEVNPGTDGDLLVTVDAAASGDAGMFYINAMMIETETEDGLLIQLSEMRRWLGLMAFGLLGVAAVVRTKRRHAQPWRRSKG